MPFVRFAGPAVARVRPLRRTVAGRKTPESGSVGSCKTGGGSAGIGLRRHVRLHVVGYEENPIADSLEPIDFF